MARTVKVTKEKVMKERAWEAGDKKMKKLKKLREENKERAKHISERKRKQLKAMRDEKLEWQRKIQRDASPKRNSEIPERGRSPY